MPEINIPAWVRFALYLGAALALIGIDYITEKGWAGAPEVDLVTQLAALASVLAASRVDLKSDRPRRRRSTGRALDTDTHGA